MNKLNEEILAKFLMGECTEDELREAFRQQFQKESDVERERLAGRVG